jgi:hypothetical protein
MVGYEQVWLFTGIISHRMPLQQGVVAYKMFKEVGVCCTVRLFLETSSVRGVLRPASCPMLAYARLLMDRCVCAAAIAAAAASRGCHQDSTGSMGTVTFCLRAARQQHARWPSSSNSSTSSSSLQLAGAT